jgi:hypothetical protein
MVGFWTAGATACSQAKGDILVDRVILGEKDAQRHQRERQITTLAESNQTPAALPSVALAETQFLGRYVHYRIGARLRFGRLRAMTEVAKSKCERCGRLMKLAFALPAMDGQRAVHAFRCERCNHIKTVPVESDG